MSKREGVALSAPAKINLALHVTGRRADGYHLLDSIAVFADFGDSVEIAPADELRLEIRGRFAAHAPGDRTDLAWRAAEAFFARTGLPRKAAITIEKRVPAGAGLGGGSADAATTLAGLNRMFAAGLSPQDLADLGLSLGADVPMCLAGQPLRARGVGELIDTIGGWPALPLVLVWPGVPVSTAACYGALSQRSNRALPDFPAVETPADVARVLLTCRNDLEKPAHNLVGEIGAALAKLGKTRDCLMARMSGSGSACFGLYPSEEAARLAAFALAGGNPGWWVAPTLARCDEGPSLTALVSHGTPSAEYKQSETA